MVAREPLEVLEREPAARVEARSTHGAGDHFVGALAAGLARRLSLAARLQEASDAAGPVVAHPP